MALPSLSTPEFNTTIPSTGQKIAYRPFLVKEEKILLMAMEGSDNNEITRAIENLLSSCILTDIDIKKLATFDIEYLFLKLRGKSVGELVELQVTHTEGHECKHATDYALNLDEIEVQGNISDGKVMITDTVGVKMRYPTVADVATLNLTESDDTFALISKCIEYIYDANEVYSEFSEQEIIDWVGNLSQSQFKAIASFFEDMPKLKHEIKWTCPECKEEDSRTIEGLQSFFMSV